jgi:hypothetical protein
MQSTYGLYNDNCIMERNAWGGPSIMVWGGIGLNVKLGPVIFQNLGPGRGKNGGFIVSRL